MNVLLAVALSTIFYLSNLSVKILKQAADPLKWCTLIITFQQDRQIDQIDRQIDGCIDRLDRQIDGCIDRQIDQIYRQIRQMYRQIRQIDRWMHRQIDRQIEVGRKGQRGRERPTYSEKEKGNGKEVRKIKMKREISKIHRRHLQEHLHVNYYIGRLSSQYFSTRA